LIQHWWDADNDPFLAKETIARRMGKSPRQIQRYLTELEEAGFVRRIPRFKGHKAQTANAYDLDGLVLKLAEIESAFAKEIEQKRLRQKKIESRAASAT
jgi:DNA-binding IclR family transcriptional regulator